MAKVISLFKLSGTISDLTFRQTKDGVVAQMKPGPSRERVLHHERFRITRLVAAEFTMAGKEAKLLRDALRSAKDGMHVASLNGRMNGLFYKVAMSDTEHRLGERHASNGNMQLLAGFDFNKELLLANALPAGIRHRLDAATGRMKVELPAFIARKKKGFPKEATHFRIVSCGAVIDFARRSHRNDILTSELMPLRKKTPGDICLEHTLEAGAGEVLVQVLGMQLYRLEEGKEVLLQGGAMRILEVGKVGEGIEATRQSGNEGGRQEGIEELKAEVAEVGNGVGCTEEPGGAPLEVVMPAVDECLPEGIAGNERGVRRHRKRGRGSGGGSSGKMEVRTGLCGRGGTGLLICRSSVDLHYICNPSDGTRRLPVIREGAGAPGNDP